MAVEARTRLAKKRKLKLIENERPNHNLFPHLRLIRHAHAPGQYGAHVGARSPRFVCSSNAKHSVEKCACRCSPSHRSCCYISSPFWPSVKWHVAARVICTLCSNEKDGNRERGKDRK